MDGMYLGGLCARISPGKSIANRLEPFHESRMTAPGLIRRPY
jgi:hypothetical protein